MRAKVVAVGLVALVAVWGLLALGVIVASYAPVEPTDVESQIRRAKWQQWGVSAGSEEEARNKLPFESLVEWLPKGKPISPSQPLSQESKARWDDLDGSFTGQQNERVELLKTLHDKTRRFFVESPKFGPERRGPLTANELPELLLMYGAGDHKIEPERQPGERAIFPTSEGEPISRIVPRKEFHTTHEGGIREFFNPFNFGYVKDREHVSGFRSHGFRTTSYLSRLHLAPQGETTSDLENHTLVVKHIQLLGILTQPEPVVYLTDKLPSMEQVRQGKTRKLDLFETAGLAELRKGDDLFIAKKGEAVRMLGALRATKVCLQCHDAKEGDMLGAFSYTLRLYRGE